MRPFCAVTVVLLSAGVVRADQQWSVPQPFSPANSAASETNIAFADDCLSFYVSSNRAGGSFAVLRSVRETPGSPWSEPSVVFDTPLQEGVSWVGPDNCEIYLFRHGANYPEEATICRATRAQPADPWGSLYVVNELNGPAGDYSLRATADNLYAVFTSWRPGGAGGADLWWTSRTDPGLPWMPPAPLAELNLSGSDEHGTLSADGLRLIFASQRPGSEAKDLYVTTRASRLDPWNAPVRIDELCSTASDQDPWLAPDGQTIYFRSNRSGNTDIWYATWIPEPASVALLALLLLAVPRRSGRCV